jgi:hypothetical protein
MVEGLMLALLEVLIIGLIVHIVVCSMAVEVADHAEGAHGAED